MGEFNITYDLEVVEVEMVDIVVLEAYHKWPDSVNQSFLIVDDWMEVHLLVAYFLDYTVRFQTVLVADLLARSVDNNLAKMIVIKHKVI